MNLECRLTSLASNDCHEKKHKRVNDFVKRFLLLGALVGWKSSPVDKNCGNAKGTPILLEMRITVCAEEHI
jgi:hypothetical protein